MIGWDIKDRIIGLWRQHKIFLLLLLAVIALAVIGFCFVASNQGFYRKPIAKITAVSETKDEQVKTYDGSIEQIDKQQLDAVLMNGPHKGEKIKLQNTTSYSQTFDSKYKVGDEVFVSLTEGGNKSIVSAQITDAKRDIYIAYAALLFLLFTLVIGGVKGARSLASLAANIVIFSAVIELYLHGFNLIGVATAASLLFIVLSILLVSGVNEKSASAILGTVVSTLFAMLVAVIVMAVTHNDGIHYEEMEFLTRPPKAIFLMEILIGTLGGIMDIAISISSAIAEMCRKNAAIGRKTLFKSGLTIGRDIMGTMANTVAFAYISGSLPLILLLLQNGYTAFNIINFNISLEIVRALVGGIGIVASIPITLYIAVMLLNRKKMEEA